MAKVRVYQLARKYDISSEALRKILVKEGITVKSHMSSVDEKVEAFIEAHLKRVKAATTHEVRKKDRKPPQPKIQKRPKSKKARKTAKKPETDHKAVKESVKRTLAKLDVTRKSRRRKREKDEIVEVEEDQNLIKLPEFSTVADLCLLYTSPSPRD